ncbi:uncharacterized protein ANIA_10385 [Aspergillus nidulans FGSC A4]|uniref:Uncharacterized protein n=1 Tax=Emericella nidulans (strain FGSC A4 / ATCC 38163 / CBS 112.46 / NRRL 194 / M139) TaxID=227321 RepID=C8VIA0_EMENI|nr:hypothetical protein [Aspergillus nidulans FGSC A4]CBF83184.1 TPA: hypothetical protein ANIA_10385 [Aspergillus nidulans FGSC A4]
MSKASKKPRKSGASRDETEALADYLARLAPFVDDGENPTATRTARRALRHYTVERQNFLFSLGLDSNMSFPQALNRAVNIVHQLDDDLDEARKEIEELAQNVSELVKKNDELQTTNSVLEDAHDTLAQDKKDIEMVATNRERQLDTECAETNKFREKYYVVAEELLRRDKERYEAKALVEKFNELWTDIFKGWEDVCGSRADRRFKYGVSGVWKHLCDNIWCPDMPLPSNKAADLIRRYCPPVAGHKNADFQTRVRGIVDQAGDLRNELENSQFTVHINPALVRLEQDPYLSPTVVIFTSFGFAESLGYCNVPGTHPEANSRDAAV